MSFCAKRNPIDMAMAHDITVMMCLLCVFAGISGANFAGHDELCRTSDIENCAENYIVDIVVWHLFCGGHCAWHQFRYIQ